MTAEGLILPDATRIEFGAVDADDQFAQIFRTSCRQSPTDDEQAAAFQAYRRALFQKMRELEPSLKDRIDAAETQR